jgi:tRNA pseudouridine synthase 9
VNGKTVSTDYNVKGGDRIVHSTHRHEPPVLMKPGPVDVIQETDCFLVVNKPSTVPMHSCGAYR